MRFSSNKLSRDAVLSRYFPQYRIVAPQAHTGLSGASCIIERGTHRLVLRQPHDALAPEAYFLRQYHALQRLPADLAPHPRFYTSGWLTVDYLAGEIKTGLPGSRELAELLYYLHQQPRFGWRIALMPLLDQYWQQSDTARRTPFWLAQLKRLRRQGEPEPLRLAPLHMDVHAGNIVHTASGLRLIDWEYAGDGDIALELAAVWTQNAQERQQLLAAYAQIARVDIHQLERQVTRWRPWVLLLMAGWYELRWRQSGDKQFISLADEIWRQLQTKG